MKKKNLIKTFTLFLMIVCMVVFNTKIAYADEEENDNESGIVKEVDFSDNSTSDNNIIFDIMEESSNENEIVYDAVLFLEDDTMENENIVNNDYTNPNINEIEDVKYEYSDTILQGEIIRIDNGVTIYSLGPNQVAAEDIATSFSVVKTENGLTATTNGGNITIDGNFDDWADKPMSYEYNWDNSDSCWYWGVWIDGVCYKTEVGTYDTNVRHGIQLYTDGEYAYLHIIKGREYTPVFNGNDYQFTIDEQTAAFRVVWEDGTELANMSTNTAPGVYKVTILHRNNDMSSGQVYGAEAYLKINENNLNNEIELKIPLSEMKRQNDAIDLEHVSQMSYFNPNLMYNRIYSSGTSTLPIIGIGLCLCGGGAGYFFAKKKKKNKEIKKDSLEEK